MNVFHYSVLLLIVFIFQGKASEVAALKEGVYNNNLELRLKPLLYK